MDKYNRKTSLRIILEYVLLICFFLKMNNVFQSMIYEKTDIDNHTQYYLQIFKQQIIFDEAKIEEVYLSLPLLNLSTNEPKFINSILSNLIKEGQSFYSYYLFIIFLNYLVFFIVLILFIGGKPLFGFVILYIGFKEFTEVINNYHISKLHYNDLISLLFFIISICIMFLQILNWVTSRLNSRKN